MVAINVHVEEVIEMLAYSDRGVGSLMALVTGIVIAYNVAVEPMAVAPLPKPAVRNSEISLIEFLCRSDLLVSVYDSDVDVVWKEGWLLIVGLNLEGEVIMALLHYQRRIGEDAVDLEFVWGYDCEEVYEETADLHFETWATVKLVKFNFCVIRIAGGIPSSVNNYHRNFLSRVIGVDIDSTINIRKLDIRIRLYLESIGRQDLSQRDQIVSIEMVQWILVDEIGVSTDNESAFVDCHVIVGL